MSHTHFPFVPVDIGVFRPRPARPIRASGTGDDGSDPPFLTAGAVSRMGGCPTGCHARCHTPLRGRSRQDVSLREGYPTRPRAGRTAAARRARGDQLLRAVLLLGGVRAASAWTWPGRVSRGRARPRSHAELLPRRRRVGRPHARLGRVPRRAIPHQHITELGRQDGHPCGAPVPPAGVATFAHARAHAWAVTISRPRPAWTPTPRRSRGAATTPTRARASRPTGIVASSNHDHDASRSPPPLSRVGVESLASSSVRAAGVAGAGVAAAGGPPLLFFT